MLNGRVASNPRALVVPERARIQLDGAPRPRAGWRTLLLHKPRGVVTTTRDPAGRRTIYDVPGDEGEGSCRSAGSIWRRPASCY